MIIFNRLWLVCLLLCGALVPLSSAQAVTIKIATLSPEGTAWMKMLRQAAGNIKQRTDGAVQFKIYPGGVMGDDKAVLRKLRIGQLHGAALTSGGVMQPYQDIVLYNLPLTFRSAAEVDYVRERMDAKLMAGLAEQKFIGFGVAEVGFAYPMMQEAVTSVAEFQDLRVWAPDNDPGAMKAYSSFNVTPIPLPIADVLTGLQTGLINTIGSPPIGAIALQWHTQISHTLNLPLLYVYGSFVITERMFKRLSAEQQQIVTEELTAAVKAVDRASRKDNDSAAAALVKQGIVWLEPAAEEATEWFELAAQANAKLIDEGYVSRPMYDEMMQHLSDYRAAAGSD
ncbi:MAG TPA: C4-dicarboxylate ABC transporter [Gammaproteobacteria bacterium]|jgi:TRAP-type C4-dicarboxylate transport system substrate-binding protein|nr:C4-dicarboxylate ABC transporter [Gammaproteobacteria bacterium]|tara:strand:+ start:300 stop:1319 length:1020 start_codon:yes stop_codon:yes gene_type:complete